MDLITFAGPISGKVIGFRGTEKMSRPYEFEIFVQTTGDVDLETAAGAKASLTLDRGMEGSVPFYFSGVISHVEVVYAYETQVVVRATLVPKLWELTLSTHSRMFTMMRIPDIISLVLAENGVVEVELRLSGAYSVEEHVCQYRETDFDFVSRWMEKEGIFYFFEHGPEGERLILCDSLVYDPDPLGGVVPYPPQLIRNASAPGSLRTFGGGKRTLPQQVRVTDYNYMMPSMPLMGMSPVQPTGNGEVVLFGERFFDPGSGQKYAMMRAQELLARERVATGKGSRWHLRPGYVFAVEGHPVAQFNMPFVTIEARHSANHAAGHDAFRELIGVSHDEVYQVEIEAIPALTQYRAQSVTPWPRIYGFTYGEIDAAAGGPYAIVDDQGRYNVRFKFDESSLAGGQASTFVRMMQPHGGDVEGFHFPLRKGMEVVIGFLDGDPDRPVILGIAPNATKPSPVTASNNTRNIIQTGGRNRIEMEDQAGQQWLHLSTPSQSTHLFLGATGVNAGSGSSGGDEGQHNFVLETMGTGHLHTQGKWDINVEDKLNEMVTNDVTEQYQSDTSQTVQGKKKHMVMSGQEETIIGGHKQKIVSGTEYTIVGDYKHLLSGDRTDTHTGDYTIGHTGMFELTRSGPTTETLQAPVTRNITGTMKHAVSGPVTLTAPQVSWEIGGLVDWKIGGDVKIECANWKVESKGEGKLTYHGPVWEKVYGFKNELFMGEKTEVFLGMKNEANLAVKHELSLAEKTGFTIGALTEVTAAVKFTLELAIALEISAGLKYEAHPFGLEMKTISSEASEMENRVTALETDVGDLFNKITALENHI